MKKFAPLCLAMITLFISLTAFSNKHHKTVPAPKYENQDSTKHHDPKDKKKHPNVGGSLWSISVMVTDLTGKPLSNATVTLPCSGSSPKPTNSSGIAVFGGNAPCPCTEAKASVSTSKGCDQTITVSCDSSYTVTCNQ